MLDHPHCHSTTLVVFQSSSVVVDSVCADRGVKHKLSRRTQSRNTANKKRKIINYFLRKTIIGQHEKREVMNMKAGSSSNRPFPTPLLDDFFGGLKKETRRKKEVKNHGKNEKKGKCK